MPSQRRSAVEFFEMIGDAALPALPSLITALGDPDRFVRWSTARTIANLPPEQAAAAVPQLARPLFDTDNSVKLTAAAALETIGPHAAPAVPALRQYANYCPLSIRLPQYRYGPRPKGPSRAEVVLADWRDASLPRASCYRAPSLLRRHASRPCAG
jgi:hypothetical protein